MAGNDQLCPCLWGRCLLEAVAPGLSPGASQPGTGHMDRGRGLAFQPRVLRMSSSMAGGGVGMEFGANKVLVCSVGCGGSRRVQCRASTSLRVFLWLLFCSSEQTPKAGDADDK